jgi:hypothetical protein
MQADKGAVHTQDINHHEAHKPQGAAVPIHPSAKLPTRGHAVVHLPACVREVASQPHIRLRLGTSHSPRVCAQSQHARHKADQVVKLVLDQVAVGGN